ncbi:hypothetical protein THAOC_15094 [Thalassiosira oceanica]|uniref:Uncharacterized protein n=1 Tax=Thalassiosira oceanica TaxID=159749 RepID=K0SFX1_THAOC|nr:hypothetical protein THAOC_15094 [Thalassiosira oceanica]|eukprot:EJK64190.1 hypothetical protein THAOC_15094 [Thalassiosira oceanica]
MVRRAPDVELIVVSVDGSRLRAQLGRQAPGISTSVAGAGLALARVSCFSMKWTARWTRSSSWRPGIPFVDMLAV